MISDDTWAVLSRRLDDRQLVVLFAMDYGVIPWRNAAPKQLLESRRLFYVGFTRAKKELHLMHSAREPSPFVTEVEQRLTRGM